MNKKEYETINIIKIKETKYEVYSSGTDILGNRVPMILAGTIKYNFKSEKWTFAQSIFCTRLGEVFIKTIYEKIKELNKNEETDINQERYQDLKERIEEIREYMQGAYDYQTQINIQEQEKKRKRK